MQIFRLIKILSNFTNALDCISMNQECKVRPGIISINSNKNSRTIMSRTNETRQIKWHKNCKCICRLNRIICNNKQKWNKDKCRCGCKKLIDKMSAIKDMFGIQVIVNVSVINLVMLVNI